MTKQTKKELWDAIDDATVESELESTLAMSPDERRRELVDAGVDLGKVHAEADAFFASLPGAASAPRALPAPRPQRVRPAVVVAIGFAFAAGLALVVVAVSPPPVVARSPVLRATALRREAGDACREHIWKTCLDKLDEARALDPSGDEAPEVQALRRTLPLPPPEGPGPR